MAQRFFGKKTIAVTGTPQPLIGTTLSAAVAAPNGATSTTLSVADSSIFEDSDWVVVDAGASAVERVRIESIPDSTHIIVFQLQKAHANAAFVSLGRSATILYVQGIAANAAALFLGNSTENTSTLAGVMAVIATVASGQANDIRIETPLQNGIDTSDYWIAGTAADGYIPSLLTP